MMKCKYCGNEAKSSGICSKCYDKLELIRQIRKLGKQIKEKS